ncbi:GNAT family N-acetyltransferase [Ruminococcus sp. YRD2003]|uniref:GNAT family N-acetyltransferase n=1 Tax=Ruminococcus sp. YRD2003 TaxID=1452313 RepID=UPI0009BF8E1B
MPAEFLYNLTKNLSAHLQHKLCAVLPKEYRGIGIGTELMRALLGELKSVGFGQVSLSVQKTNRAVRLYRKIGFVTIDENDEEYIMLCRL